MVDLTGDGIHELVIESNFGGAGTYVVSLQIFDLSRGRFDELLNTISRLLRMTDDDYAQVLDIGRTLQSRGKRFCTVKTTLFEDGKWFSPPRVTRPCYKRGDGIDPKEVKLLNEMLTPLR